MSKFKVGDEVRAVISGLGIASINIGRTTFITEINGIFTTVRTETQLGGQITNGWVNEESFELVKQREEIFYE